MCSSDEEKSIDDVQLDNEKPEESKGWRDSKCLGGVFCLLLLVVAGIVGFLIYYFTRPDNIDLTSGTDAYSPTSLIRAGYAGDNFAALIRIDSRTLLGDDSVVSYEASMDFVDGLPTNTTLYLTNGNQSDNTVELLAEGSFLEILNADSMEFPIDLSTEEGTFLSAGFLVNMAGETIASFSLDIDGGSVSLPSVKYVSVLAGQGYNVKGTVTFDTRIDLEGTAAVAVPYIQFENIEPPEAPGPYMYISKNPYRRGQQIESQDIFLPIENTKSNTFSRNGQFSQDLNKQLDLSQYNSLVIWCRPFEVFLGGGSVLEVDK
jgi:hypothetical protein